MLDRGKVYRALLKLYPARFREEYEAPMERQFQDEYREASRVNARVALWLRAIADLAFSIPAERFRECLQDLHHASRVYGRRKLSAAMSVLALGLGIGASTGIFSVLDALLVRGLPFSNPQALVELQLSPFGAGRGRAGFAEWRSRSPYLQSAATFSLEDANLVSGGGALRVKLAETSANFFQLLGTEAAVGRAFAPDEDAPGRTGVAVISNRLWQQAYGGSPSVIGALLRLNGLPFTVIGVAPASFDYPAKTNVWTPTVFDFETVPKRGAFLFQTIGRLKDGVSIQTAGAMFDSEIRRVTKPAPGGRHLDGQNRPRVISIRDQLAGPVGRATWVLAGMILLLLLAACASVAQLLISRTTERGRELAIRAALGASRARLVQQLVTEGMALTFIGAALGLPVAEWVCRLASSIAPAPLTVQRYTVLDWRVFVFAMALAVVMGLVFGTIPAMVAGKLQPSGPMMRIQGSPHDAEARKTLNALVALQAGLTIVLLAGSFAMGRTFLQLLDRDLGFQTAHVVTLNVSLEGTRRDGGAEWRYYNAALDRLRSVPGVDAAGAVGYLPLADNIYMAGSFKLESGQTVGQVVINATTPGYFRAIGTAFLAGGDFSASTQQPPAHSVIVNEEFARNARLGTAILGRMVKSPWTGVLYRIVGVVKTASLTGPQYVGSAQMYWQIDEEPPPALTLVARVQGDAEGYLARCRDAVHSVDAGVPVYDVMTLDQRLSTVLARPRFYTTATLFLAALAVLLATVSIYGTTLYSVAQRTQEMGIRMALGASYGRLRAMMIRENAVPIAGGLIPGIGVAIASGRFLEHLIENGRRPEPLVSVAAAGLLLTIGILASWAASARVLAIEPATAVRTD